MSCPHGVWHEEDCEQCIRENSLFSELAKREQEIISLKQQVREADQRAADLQAELDAVRKVFKELYETFPRPINANNTWTQVSYPRAEAVLKAADILVRALPNDKEGK